MRGVLRVHLRSVSIQKADERKARGKDVFRRDAIQFFLPSIRVGVRVRRRDVAKNLVDVALRQFETAFVRLARIIVNHVVPPPAAIVFCLNIIRLLRGGVKTMGVGFQRLFPILGSSNT